MVSAAHVFGLGSNDQILSWGFHPDVVQSGPACSVVPKVILFGKFGSNTLNHGPDRLGLVEIQDASASQLCQGFHRGLVDHPLWSYRNKVQQDICPLSGMGNLSKSGFAPIVVAVGK